MVFNEFGITPTLDNLDESIQESPQLACKYFKNRFTYNHATTIIITSIYNSKAVCSNIPAIFNNLNNDTNNTMIQWYNDDWHNITMIQWYNDTMIQWYNDAILQWYNDTMIQWYKDTMIQWYNNTMVQW